MKSYALSYSLHYQTKRQTFSSLCYFKTLGYLPILNNLYILYIYTIYVLINIDIYIYLASIFSPKLVDDTIPWNEIYRVMRDITGTPEL